MSNYLQHFGLTHVPLGKSTTTDIMWEYPELKTLKRRFDWLTNTPGIGVLTGEPGVGKTAAIGHLCRKLNPQTHKVIYHSETDFGRYDLYRQFAMDLGLDPSYRRASVWREIKQQIKQLVETQRQLPIWIIDEAQNLPTEFFRDFPSFLNFTFDSQSMMTVWLIGHPCLERLLSRVAYVALHSRIQAFVSFKPIKDEATFKSAIEHGFKAAGASASLLSNSGYDMIRLASKGFLRQASQIVNTALQLAASEGINHLPDEVLSQAIEELKS